MSFEACAEIVRKGDPDRFLAAMAAPLSVRGRLFAVYAFNVEVSRAPWVTSEPMIAEMRLQWWGDVMEEVQEGAVPRRHEVVDALVSVIDAQAAAVLDRLIAARRWDIYRDPFEDEAHFERYLGETSGALMQVSTGSMSQVAMDAGWAQGLANWFLAVPDLEARGRIPLVDGRPQAVAALAQQGLDRLARARTAGVDRLERPALRAAWMAGLLLRQAAAAPQRVARGSLGTSEFRKSARLLRLSALNQW